MTSTTQEQPAATVEADPGAPTNGAGATRVRKGMLLCGDGMIGMT